jgi:hypothetical protein
MSGRGFLYLQLLLSRRGLAAWLLAALAVVGSAAAAEVTFLVTSDCHYDALENEDRNQRNRETVEQMNRISGVAGRRNWAETRSLPRAACWSWAT